MPTVKGTKKINTAGSEYNALSFMQQQAMREQIHTAIPVRVEAVNGQFVDVLPLVTQVDGYGEAVAPTTLFHLPVFRYQAGVAAFICDPVVGDIGLAVFSQADSSNVQAGTSTPQQPGSFRRFSMSDGFYFGTFHNSAPTVFIEVKQDGGIAITAPTGISINSPSLNITGDATIGGISFLAHVHGGVESGGSTTSTPE